MELLLSYLRLFAFRPGFNLSASQLWFVVIVLSFNVSDPDGASYYSFLALFSLTDSCSTHNRKYVTLMFFVLFVILLKFCLGFRLVGNEL